ncbi:hypothetical protein BURPS305_5892 [Burkholderia pseudomallei 305]|nr:hypothetical protein BURPS305_5892 [Burkholderia pseudomallei 305]
MGSPQGIPAERATAEFEEAFNADGAKYVAGSGYAVDIDGPDAKRLDAQARIGR